MENHNQLPGLEATSRGKNAVFPEIRRLFTKVGLGPTHLWNAVEGLASSTKKEIGTDTKTDTGKISEKRGKSESIENTGAGNGIRTRDPRLGKAIVGKNIILILLHYSNIIRNKKGILSPSCHPEKEKVK